MTMSHDSQSSEPIKQSTLNGSEAERVECEYYDGCKSPALYIDEILHYGEGEIPVRMCESCADEHLEAEDNEVQRLKPADRYVSESEVGISVYVVVTRYDGDPHPHVELVTTDEDEAEELMNKCRDTVNPPHPVAWEMDEQTVRL